MSRVARVQRVLLRVDSHADAVGQPAWPSPGWEHRVCLPWEAGGVTTIAIRSLAPVIYVKAILARFYLQFLFLLCF